MNPPILRLSWAAELIHRNLEGPKGIPPYHLLTTTRTLRHLYNSKRPKRRFPAPLSPSSWLPWFKSFPASSVSRHAYIFGWVALLRTFWWHSVNSCKTGSSWLISVNGVLHPMNFDFRSRRGAVAFQTRPNLLMVRYLYLFTHNDAIVKISISQNWGFTYIIGFSFYIITSDKHYRSTNPEGPPFEKPPSLTANS